MLADLARDAVDLFGSPLAQRIRVSAAADCGLLYVDQSRTGNRQWCSMQRCGTRAKVRAYRVRNAGTGPDHPRSDAWVASMDSTSSS